MNRKNSKTNTKIEELGQMLGLTRENIAAMLRDIPAKTEQPSFDLGPGPYRGTFYGTISIYDMEKSNLSNVE